LHVNGCFSAYWADAEDYTKFTKYTGISGNPYKWKKKRGNLELFTNSQIMKQMIYKTDGS
jgi:hypothetical protein